MSDESGTENAFRAASQEMSRRALLRGAGLLGVGVGFGLTGLLTACGVAADDANHASAGGTLTLGIDGTSAVNDPAFYSTLGDWMAVDCVCRGLTFISFETNDPQPDLAESWDISADGLTYTFHLRKGVTFHDGTTFTAADTLASLGRQFNADDKTLPDGAARLLADIGPNVVSMTAVDAYTVRIVLKSADRTLLNRLSDIGGRIISKAALDKYGKDIGKHLVGTGPFMFRSATAGQSIVLEAFADFRLGKPPIDRLVLQQVQDPTTIVSSLLSGDLSATQFTPYSAIGQLKTDKSVTVYETPQGFDAIMMIDARRIPEIEVRKAINLAIDRKAIIAQAFFGIAALPDGFALPPSLAGHDPGLADLSTQNLTEAKRLIEAKGAVGREVRMMAASDSWHPKVVQIITQNLTDIGLKVSSDLVDPATYFTRLLDTTDKFHDLMIWERNSYIPDPDDMIGAMAMPDSLYGDTLSGFNKLSGAAAFTDDLTKAKNLPNGAARTAAYTDIQRRFAEQYMVLSMLAYSTNPVVSGAKVNGMNVDALANHRCFMEKASV
jgi:ABC-type transport system substrate-binding protein